MNQLLLMVRIPPHRKDQKKSLSHMQNWSLIGAALRNELPSKVNMSLADNVMAQIKNENIKPEPAKIKEISLPSFKIAFKKFSFGYRPGSTSSNLLQQLPSSVGKHTMLMKVSLAIRLLLL